MSRCVPTDDKSRELGRCGRSLPDGDNDGGKAEPGCGDYCRHPSPGRAAIATHIGTRCCRHYCSVTLTFSNAVFNIRIVIMKLCSQYNYVYVINKSKLAFAI